MPENQLEHTCVTVLIFISVTTELGTLKKNGKETNTSQTKLPCLQDCQYMFRRDLLLQPIHKKLSGHDSIWSQKCPCLTVEPALKIHVNYQIEEHIV
jgi:hypothetical protein